MATCEVTPQGKPCGGGSDEGNTAKGTVTITKISDELTEIAWNISGLSPGLHGFHIHEKADFSNGCVSCGPHYNPHNKTHGGPADEERHVGDLGNIEANADGIAKGSIKDKLIKIDGEFSVIGRSFMVHADEDDLGTGNNDEPGVNGKTSKSTGNAGARIACGVIIASSSL